MSETLSQNQTTPMLDVFLAQIAQEDGKKLHAIETPKEQCNPLYSINEKDVIIFKSKNIIYRYYFLLIIHYRIWNGWK